jgi:mannose-6-phosphate isomerase-like protein (cupin superfamily)
VKKQKQMSKIAKVQANKKHNVPDFKVIGSVIPDIIKKINGIVIEKKENDVIDVIDYINNRIQTKITNISVDTWDEAFETDWKRSSDYSTPTCAVFLVAKGSALVHVEKKQYELSTGKICIVNEWCTHKLVNTSSAPLTMLLAQFTWDSTIHENN